MQHDLLRSGYHLDLRSNFQHDLLRSIYSTFHASWQEEHDAGNMNIVPLLSNKLLQKLFSVKTGYFTVFALWSPRGAVAFLVPEYAPICLKKS